MRMGGFPSWRDCRKQRSPLVEGRGSCPVIAINFKSITPPSLHGRGGVKEKKRNEDKKK
jgi:hypothetical protein